MLTLEDTRLTRDGFTLTANFDLAAPGLVAVIGPSGGGKSTLLSLIAGFDLPDAGRVLWHGRDLGPDAPGDRPVAVLFQDNNLFPHMTVLDNVCLGVSPRSRPSSETRARASDALGRVGLRGFEGRKPGALSGGQQSRAALARVLLTDRDIVLMDEAFSALGPALRAEMLDLVAELLPDRLVLMVTHDPDEARRKTDRTIFVEDGQVSGPVETDALFSNPTEALARYLA